MSYNYSRQVVLLFWSIFFGNVVSVYGLENELESQETNYNHLLVNNSDIAAGPQFRHLVSV